MDWITGIQRAIDYIEAHLNDELDPDVIAREGFSSNFHFQRVFSILCGYTLGEYIRSRRLSVAGSRLASGSERVVDIALEFGYDSPDSFTKAFRAFHGITPSQARGNGAMLHSFSRLNIKVTLEGGNDMQYKLEEKPAMLLTGFKRRFSGDPIDKKDQDHYFACETRVDQYVLEGRSRIHDTIYTVMTNFGDNGYDFYFAYLMPKWALEDFDEETLTTIFKFFENNLNVSETSRQLFIHRNTLVYRLDKLQKSTGLDLRIFEDAITFKIALMVAKYMRYMDSLEY